MVIYKNPIMYSGDIPYRVNGIIIKKIIAKYKKGWGVRALAIEFGKSISWIKFILEENKIYEQREGQDDKEE